MVKGKGKGKGSVKYTTRVSPLLKHVNFSGATNKKVSGPNQEKQIEGKIGIDTPPGGSLIIPYYQLLKDSKKWYACGQVKMGMEYERRAKALLNGNFEEYKKVVHSEYLYSK